MSPVTLWQKICAGLFVTLAVGVWVFINIALSGPQGGRSYHTFLKESVRGLAPGSLVCLNGITIGKIASVSNDFKINAVKVNMLITDLNAQIFGDLEKDGKQETGTRAQLITSFVTGIQYIDLNGGCSDCPVLPENNTIPAIDTSFTRFSNKIEGIVAKVESLLNPQTLANIEGILANVNGFTHNLNENVVGKTSDTLVSKAHKVLDNLEKISGENQQKLLETTLQNLAAMSDLQKLGIDSWLQNITKDSQEALQSAHLLLTNLNTVVNSQGKSGDVVSAVHELHKILAMNETNLQKTIANLERLSSGTATQLTSLIKETNATMRSLSYFLQKELTQTNSELQGTLKELAGVLRILKARPNALIWGAEVK